MRNPFNQLYEITKFLYLQRIKGFSPPGEDPHMPTAEIDRFKKEIGRARNFIEFGSGGSTVYASRMRVETISVENDRFYARAVAKKLSSKTVTQIVAGMGITREWGMPLFPSARKARRYVTAPWDLARFPDFILVDGRYRVACALESARRAHACNAAAVLMFDDYANRPFYHIVEQFLGRPEIVGRAAIFLIGTQIVPHAAVDKWLENPA